LELFTHFRLFLLLLLTLLVTTAPSAASHTAQTNSRQTQLHPGDSIERELAGGQSHSYEIEVAADQFLHVIVEQQGIDVVLTIFDTGKNILNEVDRPNGSRGRESISLIAPRTARYSLEVRSLESVAAQGRYRLSVDRLRPTGAHDQTRIAAEQTVSQGEILRAKGSAESIGKAIENFKRAADLWYSLAEPYEEAVAFYGAGVSYSSLGDNQQAVQNLERSLTLFGNDSYGEAIAHSAMGWPYMYLGDYEAAENNFKDAFEFHRSQNNIRGQGVTLYGMGWVSALRGDNTTALARFNESLLLRRDAQDRRGEALTLTGIGKIEMRLVKQTAALESFNTALRVLPLPHDRYVEGDILSNMGWAYTALNEDSKALDAFNRGLSIRREVGDRIGEATTLYGLSRLQRRSDKLPEARSTIEDALKIIESLRVLGSNQQLRISYFASIQDYYEYYVGLLMQLNRLEPSRGYSALALRATESAHARGLIDLLASARTPSVEEEQNNLMQAEPLTAAQIQNQLDGQTTLLEYSLGEQGSYAWIVTRKEIFSFELPPREKIEALARELYAAVTERNRPGPTISEGSARLRVSKADITVNEKAQALGQILLSPLKENVRGSRLLIVAPGALQFIPFALLPSPANYVRRGNREPNRRPEAYRPLITDYELVVLPSASSLSALRQVKQNRNLPSKTVAVIADPVFSAQDARVRPASPARTLPVSHSPSEPKTSTSLPLSGEQTKGEFSRLISSRWEAQQILSLAPAPQGKLFLDFAADRSIMSGAELADYRFLHIATHAVIDDQRPERSRIVFSLFNDQGHPQDGFVTLSEIFNLNLPVDMVVLSACRTGLGKDFKGEGLVGLTRGFMHAGAKRVVVSLWDVSDKATSELMVRFYRKMLGPEKLAPVAALRAAQLELSQDPRWQSPYFWAAFVIQGEPN